MPNHAATATIGIRPEFDGEMQDPLVGRFNTVATAQVAYREPSGLPLRRVAQQCEVGQARGRYQRFGRAGMHLVIQFDSLGVISRQLHAAPSVGLAR